MNNDMKSSMIMANPLVNKDKNEVILDKRKYLRTHNVSIHINFYKIGS